MGYSWVSIQHIAEKNMNLTKKLPPPQNECVTRTTEDEKAKGK